ncbi:MAG: TIGR04283 family arsenosugar biosynthesis glycosyltransferase [Alphaproteobacteria bacterium]
MISIIIPTYNAAAQIGPCLGALVPGAVAGQVRELILSDGGSTDDIAKIADGSGAQFIEGDKGRGGQLARGAATAKGPWLLFLHADTVLADGWIDAVSQFVAEAHQGQAACFTFALADPDPRARRVEKWARRRARWFGLPYGDQGLLIHKQHYQEIGGFPDMPLMEDVALIRRIRKRDLTILPVEARTSPARYRTDGYWFRPLKNIGLLALYLVGVPARSLARLYA